MIRRAQIQDPQADQLLAESKVFAAGLRRMHISRDPLRFHMIRELRQKLNYPTHAQKTAYVSAGFASVLLEVAADRTIYAIPETQSKKVCAGSCL